MSSSMNQPDHGPRAPGRQACQIDAPAKRACVPRDLAWSGRRRPPDRVGCTTSGNIEHLDDNGTRRGKIDPKANLVADRLGAGDRELQTCWTALRYRDRGDRAMPEPVEP